MCSTLSFLQCSERIIWGAVCLKARIFNIRIYKYWWGYINTGGDIIYILVGIYIYWWGYNYKYWWGYINTGGDNYKYWVGYKYWRGYNNLYAGGNIIIIGGDIVVQYPFATKIYHPISIPQNALKNVANLKPLDRIVSTSIYIPPPVFINPHQYIISIYYNPHQYLYIPTSIYIVKLNILVLRQTAPHRFTLLTHTNKIND